MYPKTNSGQITVLVILLGLMGLTVVLSIASRSLSEIKQVSYVDSGTKAFAGAEAGLQYGLNQLSALSTAPTTCMNGNVNSLPTGINALSYSICPSPSSNSVKFSGVPSDSVVQVDLSTIAANTTSVAVVWPNSNAAMEVIDVDGNNRIIRGVYNQSVSLSFSPTISCAATCGSGQCAVVPVQGSQKLLRIKPLMGASSATDITVCGQDTNGNASSIGSPTYTITATATTADNTQKKVQVIKTLPALPSIFDYVIFTKGSISK